MASIVTRPNGCREVRYTDRDKRAKVIRLGRGELKDAQDVAGMVDRIVQAQRQGYTPRGVVATWLEDIGDDLHARLSRAGLCPPRSTGAGVVTLGGFLDQYIAKRTDLGERTRLNLKQAQTSLVQHFGKGRRMETITPADAKGYKRWLQSERGLAVSTVAMHVKKAREVFRYAVDARIIAASPFQSVSAGKMTNPDRAHFVSRADVQKIIDHCPDIDWRLIVALSRYGGLRCPSEIMLLRWGDILWDQQRITVRSPKTAKQGKASRQVPIFPELRALLEEAFEQAAEGAEFVIARHRDGNANLRTQLLRIMERAGVDPWERLFHNMRASRQTELAESFPAHVVCAWMGNSEAVAKAHYLQLRDEHFEQAAGAGVDQAHQKAHKKAHNQATANERQPTPRNREKSGKTNKKARLSDDSEDGRDTPKGSRTPVLRLRTECPGPLDDGGVGWIAECNLSADQVKRSVGVAGVRHPRARAG